MKYYQPLFVGSLLFTNHAIAALEENAESAINTMQKVYNTSTGLWLGPSDLILDSFLTCTGVVLTHSYGGNQLIF